jgi:hypothetical protein
VVERSERYASEAKPEEPEDSKRRAWAGLLAAVQIAPTNISATTAGGPARIWRTINTTLFSLFLSLYAFYNVENHYLK